ncbi:MAG: 50S ribosomal protein L32 [Candidatus Parcubacteria bacterium]|nr:50S ribosomal protein L32 [Candidatus Parcubacteria bacterium]
MSVPAKKRPVGEKRRRAAHFALKKIKYASCPKCKKPKLPHAVCLFCGTYQGREVLKSHLDKKELKKAQKQKARAAEKQQGR